MTTGSPPAPAGGSGRRHGRLRWPAAIAVLVIVVIGVGYLGTSYMVYAGVSKAPRACWPADQTNTPDNFTVPSPGDASLATTFRMPVPQDIVFRSRDPKIPEAKLAAWWIPANGVAVAEAPAVIVIHGVQSCRREPSVLLAAGMLHRHGYSVFLMDLRDHGDSEGDDAHFAAGSNEYMDVLGGWDWVRSQGVPASRIGLEAMSFGSASALIAGGQEPQVAAVWADSAYTDARTAIGLFLRDQTGLPDILVPGSIMWARVVSGDDLTKFSPIEEVTHYASRHLAFVHGEMDRVLPPSMSVELHDAAAAAGATSPDAWIVPGAGHTQGIYYDPAGYEQRLAAFFDAAIGPASD
jgi:uncharacterized protein